MVWVGVDDTFASSVGIPLVDNCELVAASDQPPSLVSGTVCRLPQGQEGVYTVCSLASIGRGLENVASSAGSDTRVRKIRLVNAMVSSMPIE